MHYLLELYSPKPAWLALDGTARQSYFATVGAGMAALSGSGAEALAMGAVDGGKLHAAAQQFYAVWRFPDEAALDALLAGIAATGWHDYFDTLNAAGPAVDFRCATLGEQDRGSGAIRQRSANNPAARFPLPHQRLGIFSA